MAAVDNGDGPNSKWKMNPAWDIKRNLTLNFPAKEIVADWIDEMSGMATALGLKKRRPYQPVHFPVTVQGELCKCHLIQQHCCEPTAS